MQIQFNTDNTIKGSEALAESYSAKLENTLSRFEERITRVEIYLSDLNSQKGGPDDKQCVLEARLNGIDPITVTHKAPTIDLAFTGAAGKLQNALDTAIGKLRTY